MAVGVTNGQLLTPNWSQPGPTPLCPGWPFSPERARGRRFVCHRGQTFTEDWLTRPCCEQYKRPICPKRTSLKRLRRNGQRWRNGPSKSGDSPGASVIYNGAPPLFRHGVTRSRRKPPRPRCRPTSLLGRSDRPLALLLSSLFFCSETLLSRFLVASQPVRDLLLCAKHLFVAARTMGCSHHQTSATSSGSVSLAIA